MDFNILFRTYSAVSDRIVSMNTKSLIILFIILSLVIAPAWATSLQQAKNKVARQTKGKVVSARTVKSGKKRVHVIKVLTSKGKVRVVRVPE